MVNLWQDTSLHNPANLKQDVMFDAHIIKTITNSLESSIIDNFLSLPTSKIHR